MIKHVCLIVALLAVAAPPFAAPARADSPEIMSRFSGPGIYEGPPDLALTLALIDAGGGPANYKTTTLLHTLAGPLTGPEVAKLTKQFGKDNVASFVQVFDFVVADTLSIVTANHVALPAKPSVDPANGKALAAALYRAGLRPNGQFNVEVMLDKLVSHPIHSVVMVDIDKKFNTPVDGDYHIILTQAMKDLKAAYNL